MTLELASLFEICQDALLLVEADSLLIHASNQAADALFGRSPNELTGIRLEAQLPGLALDQSEPQTLHGHKADGQELVVEARWRLLPGLPGSKRFLLLSLHDVTEQVREERILGWQHRTIFGLFNHEVFRGEDLEAILRVITEEATKALDVERASVWIYQEQETQIHCLDLFMRGANDHSAGFDLRAEHYPSYFEALREDRVIAAHNAHEDGRTREFSRDYLTPLGIGAMVDAPIHLGGKSIGVICLEHVGGPRHWLREEQNLVASLADMVSLAFEQSVRKRAQAALRASERMLGLVVSNAPVILFAVDQEGVVTLAEGSGLAKFGVTSEQAVGQSIFDLSVPFFRENCQRALAGETFTAAGQFDDTSFDIWYAPVRDAEGAVTGVIGVATDVTERKLFEEQRLQNEALKRSNALRDQFLSIVSHELRTPLTAIKGAASVLMSGKAGSLTDKQATFLGIIANHSIRLNHLIDDVLDLSKMEAGKMTYHLADGDLAALACEACDGFAQVFEEKGISLVLEAFPVWSRFDPDKLAQVLTNLLSNASKFTKQGGSVVVRVQEHDGQAVLEVEDDGIGIPLEHQAQLFSKFYQVDGTETRKVGGTGLGLAICKTIVEDGHGGTIGVESQVGRGTTFFIRLPLASDKRLDRPAKVLLIDDEAELNRDLAEMLAKRGLETELSSNGYEGIASAIKTPPDLVILDLLMPGMDGYEVLARLKAERSLKQLPILVHTVDASPEARERALAGGAEEVFLKWQTSAEAIVEEVLGRLGRLYEAHTGEESR